MPDLLLVDQLRVSTLALVLQIVAVYSLSVAACILLWRRTRNPDHIICWGIFSWVLPIVGPLATCAFLVYLSLTGQDNSTTEDTDA